MTNPFACPADLAEPEHRWRPGAHCYALDGIRGLAALMVLCCHCLVFPESLNLFTSTIQRFTSVGWTGVNLFFVLSGYLISGILLDTRNCHRRWKSFIARRTLRIFPVYFATLLVIFHVIPWVSRGNFGSPANPEEFATGELWYWTCLQNWAFVWRGSWTSEPGLNHLWSIAVEEQFYLIWPFLVWQFDRRTLKSACFGLIIIALLLRIGFIEVGFAPISTYALPICRMDAFCVGTLIALWHREPQWLDRWVRVLPRIACCSLLTLVFIDVWFNILRPGTYLSATLSHTVCSLVFGTIIAATATAPRNHWISVFFENSMLRLLGKYSYSLYIFHGFVQPHVFAWDWGWLPEQLRSWAIFSTIFSITMLASLLSWRLVEEPFLKLKRFFPRSVDGQSTEFTPDSKSEDIQRNEMGLIEAVDSTDAQPPTNRLPRSPRPLHSSAN